MRCESCGRVLDGDFCDYCNVGYESDPKDIARYPHLKKNMTRKMVIYTIMSLVLLVVAGGITVMFYEIIMSRRRISFLDLFDWHSISLIVVLATLTFSFRQLKKEVSRYKDYRKYYDSLPMNHSDRLKSYRDKLK